MIDDVEVIFKVNHKPFGDIVDNIKINTGEQRAYRKPFQLKNKNSSLTVKSNGNGTLIKVCGNYAKFFQHHNIFGTNNLVGLVTDVFKFVANKLHIKCSRAETNAIRDGEFLVRGVDIAGNFRAKSREEVPLIIREAECCWRDLGKNVSNYGRETVYIDQYSGTWSFKFYDKRVELSAHPLPKDIAQREMLLKYAESLVRAELRIGAKELKERGLQRGSAWTPEVAEELLSEAIAWSGIHGPVKRVLLPDEYFCLSRNLQQTNQLWLHGAQVKSLYDSQTYRRRFNELKCVGIDIRQPQPRDRIVTIDLADFFLPQNVLMFPNAARKHGLIYLPTAL